jgi:hypothetical protein
MTNFPITKIPNKLKISVYYILSLNIGIYLNIGNWSLEFLISNGLLPNSSQNGWRPSGERRGP